MHFQIQEKKSQFDFESHFSIDLSGHDIVSSTLQASRKHARAV